MPRSAPRTSPKDPSGAAAELVERFRRQRPLRAGSLIVTLFGDSIMPRGGAIALGSLIRLAAPFGLNERLVRTATARLAHEGWLEARRVGKLSEYRLSNERPRTVRRGHRAHLRRADRALVGTLDPDRPAPHACCRAAPAAQRTRLAWLRRALQRGVRAPRGAGPRTRARAAGARTCPPMPSYSRPISPPRRRPARLVNLGWDLEELGKRYQRFVQRFEGVHAALRGRAAAPADGLHPAHAAHPRIPPAASARSAAAPALAAARIGPAFTPRDCAGTFTLACSRPRKRTCRRRPHGSTAPLPPPEPLSHAPLRRHRMTPTPTARAYSRRSPETHSPERHRAPGGRS